MNKHDYTERPHIDDVWQTFDFISVMCGAGDDSSMLLAEMYERGIEPNEIIICDTGSEFPHTYKFIEYLKKWCADRNWSKVVVIRKFDKFKKPLSVISLCKEQNTLPAAAFGSKSCSLRFKVETADKYFNNHPECWKAWGVEGKGKKIATHTGKILRLVGLNADEPNRVANWKPQDKWVQLFPLFDWDIGERDSDAVERVGLYYPGKSSCTVCPNLTHGEIAMLHDEYPDKYQESLVIEAKYIEVNARLEAEIETVFNFDESSASEESYAFEFMRDPDPTTNLRQPIKSLKEFKKRYEMEYLHPKVKRIECHDHDDIDDCDEYCGVTVCFREYTIDDLINSMIDQGSIRIKEKSTTVGLGRGKTWEQKRAEYEANPAKYKRMTNNKPCECGR